MSTRPRTAQPGEADGSDPDRLAPDREPKASARGAAGELSLIFGDDFPDRVTRASGEPGPRSHETRAPAIASRSAQLARLESAVGSLADRIEAVERLMRVVIERLEGVEEEARAAAESSHRLAQSFHILPDRPFG